MTEKVYYAIAHRWETGVLSFYDYFGVIHYGTMEEAGWALVSVQNRNPDEKYFIVQLGLKVIE